MTYVTAQQLVDPAKLLVVRYKDGTGSLEHAVVWCRYVPAFDPDGTLAVAIEIAFDPASPAPRQSYYCPGPQLVRQLIAPQNVLAIRPYAVA